MCETAQTIHQLHADKKRTEFEARVQAEATRKQNAAVAKSYEFSTQDLNAGKNQENIANAEERMQARLASRAAQSSALAQAAEGGVAGYSVDSRLSDLLRQGLDAMTLVDSEEEFSDASFLGQGKRLYEQANAGQASFTPYQPSARQFYTGAYLQINAAAGRDATKIAKAAGGGA